MSEKLDELKQEAKDLGITFNPNIGEAKLQDKIEAYYDSKESSVVEVAIEEEQKEEPVKVSNTSRKRTYRELAKELEAKARKTRVVTITDNDQRQNNHTTTATVNCSNEYFDLGTAFIPLNEKVEVRVGHLNALKEVKIPMHVKDVKSGLSNHRLRQRYAISYEDVE